MNMFLKYKKRAIVKKILRKVGPELQTKYGVLDSYTTRQIKKVYTEQDLPVKFSVYAYALFMSTPEFAHALESLHVDGSASGYKSEVGDICFQGDKNFGVEEALIEGEESAYHFDNDFGDN